MSAESCGAMGTDSACLECAACDLYDERALHREVVKTLTAEIAKLTTERDRALACEQAALGLLREVVTTVPGQGPGHSHEVPGSGTTTTPRTSRASRASGALHGTAPAAPWR